MAKSTKIGAIRAPQLVGMFGPGSIVNLERLSVMPSGVGRWPSYDDSSRIESRTFADQIGARSLIATSSMTNLGIQVVLFPQQFVCRHCGTVQKKTSIRNDDLKIGFKCYHDCGPLYPSRWIKYCEAGHIEDFDYRFFVHKSSGCTERVYLVSGASLSDTWVICECGDRKAMIDAYGTKASNVQCAGNSPWLGTHEHCTAQPKISMKSASDVYFGAVRSGISIEPESDPLISRAFAKLSELVELGTKEDAKSHLRKLKFFAEADAIDVDRAVNEYFIATESPTTYKDRRRQEFEALARDSGSPSEDLHVERLDPKDVRPFGFSGLFAVRKLREIRALVGFRRGGMPSDPSFDDLEAPEQLASVGPDGVFPAYENRGEGIFLTLDQDWLKAWLSRPAVRKRIQAFDLAETRWRKSSGRLGAQRSRGIYVLAHTFAHLLIRQLSLISGYSQASLRERIYASEDSDMPWAGLLVYTASSDADGSLGGLVAAATDGRVEHVLTEAFVSLQICSSDPVCALQTPKGFRKMNGAACHGCVVLPETCCERNNFFLDRSLVVPNTVTDDTVELCYSKPR